jgi:hypothetical protein
MLLIIAFFVSIEMFDLIILRICVRSNVLSLIGYVSMLG